LPLLRRIVQLDGILAAGLLGAAEKWREAMPELRGAVKLWKGRRGVEEVQYNHYGDEMKMIKPGILPEERKYSGVCLNCGSTYEAVEKELRYYPPPVLNHGEDGRYCATCEICSKTIYFNRMMP
jgi:hypothetical protein